jgi:hypothetical protein
MTDSEKFESHPELEGDDSDEGPVRRPTRLRFLRIVVIIGVAALVLPSIISTVGVQARTANAACAIVVAALAPGAVSLSARFELFGGSGPGWYCYATDFTGVETLMRPLGFIPGLDDDPRRPQETSNALVGTATGS